MSSISTVLNRTDKKKEFKRFIKFGLVGIIGSIVDFSILNFLIFVLGFSSPTGKIIANLISTSAAILSNFTWNRLWTFPESRKRKKRVQLVQFTLVNLVGLIINTAIFFLTDHYFFSQFVASNVSVQLAKLTAIGLVMFWNFGANRIWTYRGL